MLLHENTHKGLGISQLSLVQGNFLGTLFNFLWSRLHLKNYASLKPRTATPVIPNHRPVTLYTFT